MPAKIGVLIVDDEEIDLSMIERLLETGGQFTVFKASDYEQAVQVFARNKELVSLALLDVTLPGKNGVDLAKRLLSHKPDLRVLFISGHAGASVLRFYGVDAVDEHFLQKPLDRTTFLRRVHEALASGQPLRLPGSGDGPAS